MFTPPRTIFRAAAEYQPLLRMVGLDADGVFSDPRVVAWRKLPDRENCTLDAEVGDAWKAPAVRLHVKRYFPARGSETPAEEEVRGHRALSIEKVPTAPLVGWGVLADGRSFTIFEDLAGYRPAVKLVEAGVPFSVLLGPTADLAAKLHNAGLHHRDLYLCHFMTKVTDGPEPAVDLKLIDTARVRRLPGVLTRRRWIVKDLAQFWYSTTKLPVSDEQRLAWLTRYAGQRGIEAGRALDRLRRSVERKSGAIGRHDAHLREKQPTRNVSIPT